MQWFKAKAPELDNLPGYLLACYSANESVILLVDRRSRDNMCLNVILYIRSFKLGLACGGSHVVQDVVQDELLPRCLLGTLSTSSSHCTSANSLKLNMLHPLEICTSP